jgi:hypothetical protein
MGLMHAAAYSIEDSEIQQSLEQHSFAACPFSFGPLLITSHSGNVPAGNLGTAAVSAAR